ncbi:unnamed protein product [Thlaspi arvense]|uniref:Uncharacterized protein n=1 Tax=Thlaspi arvense TaxID=13288 RepID=A0AAU9RUU0_THLAR|nr:unnamed protein product [Thlaspi arvense]
MWRFSTRPVTRTGTRGFGFCTSTCLSLPLPSFSCRASSQNLIFPYDDMDKLIRKDREPPANISRTFEVCGMDPDSENGQHRARRQLEDQAYVSGKKLGWQDIATYKLQYE